MDFQKFYKKPYPEIVDGNFKGTLWTFKQQLALKSVSALQNFHCSTINAFGLFISGYVVIMWYVFLVFETINNYDFLK